MRVEAAVYQRQDVEHSFLTSFFALYYSKRHFMHV